VYSKDHLKKVASFQAGEILYEGGRLGATGQYIYLTYSMHWSVYAFLCSSANLLLILVYK
jgi:hypothetical protein